MEEKAKEKPDCSAFELPGRAVKRAWVDHSVPSNCGILKKRGVTNLSHEPQNKKMGNPGTKKVRTSKCHKRKISNKVISWSEAYSKGIQNKSRLYTTPA